MPGGRWWETDRCRASLMRELLISVPASVLGGVGCSVRDPSVALGVRGRSPECGSVWVNGGHVLVVVVVAGERRVFQLLNQFLRGCQQLGPCPVSNSFGNNHNSTAP